MQCVVLQSSIATKQTIFQEKYSNENQDTNLVGSQIVYVYHSRNTAGSNLESLLIPLIFPFEG